MATLLLGGEQITIPKMNFRRIKKAYPFMLAASQVDDGDPFASYDSAIEAIRVGLEQETDEKDNDGRPVFKCPISTEEFNERLIGDEVIRLQSTMADMMRESGLVRQRSDGSIVGNGDGAESPGSSTETSTQSSPNSLPQGAKEVVGSE